jgi:hypothetical protein
MNHRLVPAVRFVSCPLRGPVARAPFVIFHIFVIFVIQDRDGSVTAVRLRGLRVRCG